MGEEGTERGITEDEAADGNEDPILFVALTVKVTGVPSVRPGTVAVKTFPTVTASPREGVTVYPVTSEPPSDAGAVQVTTAERLPATADTPVGTPGTVAGVIGDEGEEAEESPRLFLATTVKVTAVPFVRPVKVAVKTLATVTVEPVEAVTM